jgi:hybrid cluster-associated redox disulfide protein
MITKEMIIGDIIRQHPATVQIFARHGLECNECQIADLETLEHGANHHKLTIDLLLNELNSVLTSSI